MRTKNLKNARFNQSELPEVTAFKESPGTGVKAAVGNRQFSIRPLRTAEQTASAVFEGETLIAKIYLGDRPRPETPRCISAFKTLGITPFILSGDNTAPVLKIASLIDIPNNQAFAEATPLEKREFLKAHPKAIMVGDGANDALALSSAFVGVALHGSMEVSLRAADVYVTRPGLDLVAKLILISRQTMRTIYRNFAFSLAYNTIGGIAAVTGHITPLMAAILMPLSAFTVFSSSL